MKKAIALKGGLVDLVWDGNLKRQQVQELELEEMLFGIKRQVLGSQLGGLNTTFYEKIRE